MVKWKSLWWIFPEPGHIILIIMNPGKSLKVPSSEKYIIDRKFEYIYTDLL